MVNKINQLFINKIINKRTYFKACILFHYRFKSSFPPLQSQKTKLVQKWSLFDDKVTTLKPIEQCYFLIPIINICLLFKNKQYLEHQVSSKLLQQKGTIHDLDIILNHDWNHMRYILSIFSKILKCCAGICLEGGMLATPSHIKHPIISPV